MSPLRLRAQWWHKIDLSECRPRYYACISCLLLFNYNLTLKKKVTLYGDALTHRWQLWAPLWIGALLWRHMFLGTTTCCLGCAHTTLGAASISFGRPSAPHQQPPGISRSSLWGMISTRSVPFTAVTKGEILLILAVLTNFAKLTFLFMSVFNLAGFIWMREWGNIGFYNLYLCCIYLEAEGHWWPPVFLFLFLFILFCFKCSFIFSLVLVDG